MKKADDIVIKRGNVTLKQFSSVGYLGCLLDSTLSGEGMALKVLKKANGKLSIFTGRENTSVQH